MADGAAETDLAPSAVILQRWRAEWELRGRSTGEGFATAVELVADRLWGLISGVVRGDDTTEAQDALATAASGLALASPNVEAIHEALSLLVTILIDQTMIGSGPSTSTAVLQATMQTASVAAARYVAEVERTADFDSLTGLRRRDTFERELRSAIAEATENGERVTLAIVDLDDLKKLNDQGYGVGDAALASLARALTEDTKAGDTAYRWGGDEFPVIFKRAARDDAETALWRVEASGAPAFSRGVATFPDEADSINELWTAAEARLKEEKRDRKAGRDHV